MTDSYIEIHQGPRPAAKHRITRTGKRNQTGSEGAISLQIKVLLQRKR